MEALGARELWISGETQLTERDVEQDRSGDYLIPGRPFGGVEVEDGVGRIVETVHRGVEGMKLDAAHVGEPHQRLHGVGQKEVDDAAL